MSKTWSQISLAGLLNLLFVSNARGSTVMSCPTKDGLVVVGDKLGRLNFGGQESFLTDRQKVLPIRQRHIVMTVGQNPMELRERLPGGGSKVLANFDVNPTFQSIIEQLGEDTDADDKKIGESLHKIFEKFVNEYPVEMRLSNTTNAQGLVFSSILFSRNQSDSHYKLALYQGFINPNSKSAYLNLQPLAGDFKASKIDLLGEDPVTKAIMDRSKPYELVGKQLWCQNFLIAPKPIEQVSKQDAALAMIEYMSFIHDAEPKKVGNTMDFYLLGPKNIETLGENLTFQEARNKFSRCNH